MKSFLSKFVVVLFVPLFTVNVYSQWSSDPTVNTPISTAVNQQSAPKIVSDAAGGAIITWGDDRNGTTDNNIYAQRIDANGIIHTGWTTDGVAISAAANQQFAPQLISDGAGGAIITWADNRDGTNDIYAQRIDADGTIHAGWTTDGIAICTAANNQVTPQIISDGAGGAIITWRDDRTMSLDYDIYAQRIDADGTIHTGWTTDGVPICTAIGSAQSTPELTSDGAGGAIITWRDRRNGTNDIYAQRIDADGTIHSTWTADGVAICTAADNQTAAQIISDDAGGAIITWEDRRVGNSGTRYDIYAQRIDSSGTIHESWTADGVAVCTAAENQSSAQIISDGAGGAIITWQDLRNGSGYGDIYAQRIDTGGAVLWDLDGVAISTATMNNQPIPQLVSDGAGGAIISWYDLRSGIDYDVYAQKIDSNGTAQWTSDGIAISTATNNQSIPELISDGAGGAMITWEDVRNGIDNDVYAARIFSDGTLASTPAAPQNLIVTDSSSISITIAWGMNIDPDFLRYFIYRDTLPNPLVRVDSTTGGISDTSKTFTGLTNGTRYYFRVTAIDSTGFESDYSNEVNAMLVPPFSITTFTPTRNALSIAKDTIITVTFNRDINQSTLNNSTIKITGSLSGLHSSTFSYDSGLQTATITPVVQFATGEEVTVTLTRGIRSVGGDSLLNAYSWGFTTRSIGGRGKFAAKADYGVGDYPNSVFSSDLDSDGDMDLAVSNRNSNNISVLLNNGDGTFATKVDYGTGGEPYSVFSSDLDSDGDMDLATANWYTNNVSVLLNNGNGTFAAKVDYGAGNYPASIFSSDLDSDGDLDLAVANRVSESVSIFLNNGNGTFAAKVDYGVGVRPSSVFFSDLDSDGDMDLTVADLSSDNVSVLLNNGNGTFAAKVNYVSGDYPISVYSSDLDSDGDMDLAVANANSYNVSVLLNKGDGTFAAKVDYGAGNGTWSVFSSDLDSDGDLDLTTANGYSNSVSVLLNNGDGTFAAKVDYGAGGYPMSVFSSDLDSDGDMDLAVVNYFSNSVSVLLNRNREADISISVDSLNFGNVAIDSTKSLQCTVYNNGVDSTLLISNITSSHSVFVPSPTSFSVLPGDSVIITINFIPIEKISYSDSLTIFSNDPNDPQVKVYVTGEGPDTIAPAAPQGLAVTDSSNETITIKWSKNTEQDFLRYFIYRDTSPNPIVRVDSTTGGISDTSKTFTGLTNGTRYYLRVTAVDIFQNESDYSNEVDAVPADRIAPTAPQDLAVTDSSSETISIKWRMNTEPDFLHYFIYRDTLPNPIVRIDSTIGGISDTSKTFTGLANGKRYYFRVTAVDSTGNESGYSNEVSAAPVPPLTIISFTPVRNALNVEKDISITVMFSQDINFSDLNNTTVRINGSLSGLHTSSFSYSSETDIATIDPATDFQVGELVSVMLTRGIRSTGGDSLASAHCWSFTIKADTSSGEFTQSSTPSVGARAVTAGDFDGDGDIDLAVAGGPNTVSILFNNGSGTFTVSSPPGVNNHAWAVTAGDLDGDGDIDLATANYDSNTVSIFLNNGSGTFTQNSTPGVGSSPTSITSGDFDGDGDIDLAVPNCYDKTVSILLNNGSGTFAESSTPSVGNYAWAITAGDLDGDGDVDLAVANSSSNTVSILLNDGSGTFTQSSEPYVGTSPRSITTGDFDDDGDIDLATANEESYTVSILLNNGTGTFTESSTPGVGNFPWAVTAGDLDGDGDIDLTTANYFSDKAVILLNNGSGTFSQSSAPDVGDGPWSVTTGDLDGDGDIDLAVANELSLTVSILLNAGTTGVENSRTTIPIQFVLAQNYPNPFNPSTTINYDLPVRCRVTLDIYNILGQRIVRLVNNEQEAGFKTEVWRPNVASGLYIYRLEAVSADASNKRFVDVKKMILMK